MNPSDEVEGVVVIRPRPVERPWGGPGVPELGLGVEGAAPVGEWWVPTDSFGPLVKIIDARENLSIQLHPNDEIATELGHPSGKTEAWYILDARPGAKLLIGLKAGNDPDAFIDAAERGEDISVWLEQIPARPGDVIFVPPGTIHAIGAGITLLEVQQDADVTFRVYDWNREPKRQLHLSESRRAIHRDDSAGVVPIATGTGQPASAPWQVRVKSQYFQLFDRTLSEADQLKATKDNEAELLFCARGHGTVGSGNSRIRLEPGLFLLRPPGSPPIDLRPDDGEELLLLRTTR